MPRKQERFMCTEINFAQEKNKAINPIVLARQAGMQAGSETKSLQL